MNEQPQDLNAVIGARPNFTTAPEGPFDPERNMYHVWSRETEHRDQDTFLIFDANGDIRLQCYDDGSAFDDEYSASSDKTDYVIRAEHVPMLQRALGGDPATESPAELRKRVVDAMFKVIMGPASVEMRLKEWGLPVIKATPTK